jgi:uncharacterized membrane protein YozB (DUF420 family)
VLSLKTLLPHVMFVINSGTVIALALGYRYIRRGDRARHRKCMITAVVLGTAFMVFYLSYHFGAGLAKFGGEGVIRPIYFSILIVHIITAAAAALIVPLTVARALSGRFDAHRSIAPFAWKLWMFVALSGITVYVMTIHLWPFRGEPA